MKIFSPVLRLSQQVIEKPKVDKTKIWGKRKLVYLIYTLLKSQNIVLKPYSEALSFIH